MSCSVCKSTFPSSSVILSILVIGHSFDCLCSANTQVPAVTQLWAGHGGHGGDLDTGEYLLLQAGMGVGWGGVNTCSRAVQGTHAVTKEKPREWGRGAHRDGQSILRSSEGFQRNQHLTLSWAKRRKQARGSPRQLRLCLLTEQMGEQPPLLWLFLWISLAPLSWL